MHDTSPINEECSGDIKSVEEQGNGRCMDVTFHSHDAARYVQSCSVCVCREVFNITLRKALCMSGYTVAGIPL